MAFRWKGTDVQNFLWNGTEANRVQRNGTTIWERQIVVNVSSTVTDMRLYDWVLANTSWNGGTAVDVLIRFNGVTYPGIRQSSPTANGGAALYVELNRFPVGSRIEIRFDNPVNIRAAGGRGANNTSGGATSGSAGGDAIRVTGNTNRTFVLNCNNQSGDISPGGGGGASASGTFSPGGGAPTQTVRAAGAGGAGDAPGDGGTASGAAANLSAPPGTRTSGGTGPSLGSATAGNGGGRGQPGGNGNSGATGGAAGYAYRGRSLFTIINASNVTRYGSQIG